MFHYLDVRPYWQWAGGGLVVDLQLDVDIIWLPVFPLLVPVEFWLWYIRMGCFMPYCFAMRVFVFWFVLLLHFLLSLIGSGRSIGVSLTSPSSCPWDGLGDVTSPLMIHCRRWRHMHCHMLLFHRPSRLSLVNWGTTSSSWLHGPSYEYQCHWGPERCTWCDSDLL